MDLRKLTIFCICVLTCQTRANAEPTALPLAKPREAISSIIEAFKTHNIVALGEGAHGNEQGHEFRLALIRDPRFTNTVNDIVVESGNSLYQDVMDRFVQGEDIAYEELRKVWQNTTQPHHVWDSPMYEAFYRAVRDLNVQLPAGKKLRVLLGDPPIEWDKVHSLADIGKFGDRDGYPVEVIKREVIAKKHRALIIYGSMHYLKKNLYFPLPDKQDAENVYRSPWPSIVAPLIADGVTVFTVWPIGNVVDDGALQKDMPQWPIPSVATVAGTQLGAKSFILLAPLVKIFRTVDGKRVGTSPTAERSPTIQEQFDAILYMGPSEQITRAELPPSFCYDEEYMAMRRKRIELAQWGFNLFEYCDEVKQKAKE